MWRRRPLTTSGFLGELRRDEIDSSEIDSGLLERSSGQSKGRGWRLFYRAGREFLSGAQWQLVLGSDTTQGSEGKNKEGRRIWRVDRRAHSVVRWATREEKEEEKRAGQVKEKEREKEEKKRKAGRREKKRKCAERKRIQPKRENLDLKYF